MFDNCFTHTMHLIHALIAQIMYNWPKILSLKFMPPIFNLSKTPSIFGHTSFRVAYTLLPAIREIALRSLKKNQLQVVSIACGTALELPCFEMLSRSRDIKVNYVGCDINKEDLQFNSRVFKKRTIRVAQKYIYADLAASPPAQEIAKADCILWRHPEFLSDHAEIPKQLIVTMAQILLHVLQHKNEHSPILITCYDPHEMMLVLELLTLFCQQNIQYTLHIDKHSSRASFDNPFIAPDDKDPLFNLNHHDQFQLTISTCSLSQASIDTSMLIGFIAKALQRVIVKIPTLHQKKQLETLEQLNNGGLEELRTAVTFLNDEIRTHETPLIKREEFISILSASMAQTHSPVFKS